MIDALIRALELELRGVLTDLDQADLDRLERMLGYALDDVRREQTARASQLYLLAAIHRRELEAAA